MKGFRKVFRVVLCMSVLAFAIGVPPTRAAGPPSGLDVNVVNTPSNPVPVTLQGTSTVSGNVAVTNTPNVNVVNTPTVNVGNSLKPSQLVAVTSNVGNTGISCHATGGNPVSGATAIDLLQNADATSSSFSIPNGKVLVITDAQAIAISLGSAGHEAQAALIRVGTGGTNSIAEVHGPLDSGGRLAGAFTFPTGAVVKSGVALCVQVFDFNTLTNIPFALGTVHGYLADDQ